MLPVSDVRERLAQARGFPWRFWVLLAGTLITALGGAIIVPFLALYFFKDVKLSMMQIGLLVAAFALCGIPSQLAGGHLMDRIGRKVLMLLSLLLSAATMFAFGYVKSLTWLLPLTLCAGFIGPIFGLASNTIVADMFQVEQRMRAYSLLRIAGNISAGMGPALGGFLVTATASYQTLFNTAAGLLLAYFFITLVFLKETRPAQPPPDPAEEGAQHFWDLVGAFRSVFRDTYFVGFCWVSVLALAVYTQMTFTFPVFIHKYYQIPEQGFGLLMSLNAVMIVSFQYWITRWTEARSKTLMMALGSLLLACGFGSVYFASTLGRLSLCVIVWTLGEMILTPVSTAFVAEIASEAKRGRYMAVFGLTWAMGFVFGPILGGIFMEFRAGHYAEELWIVIFFLAVLAAVGYLFLGGWGRLQPRKTETR
jgi:MFS family permease